MKQRTIKNFRSPWEMAGLAPSTPVLLAFSGGADSRALLHLLAERSKHDGFDLYLVHVNHGIRGEEALRDQCFCQALAQTYGLPIFVKALDVPRMAKENGKGMEETAREARYAYFAELMRTQGIPILVTAHHADDNLETLLFRISSGSGTHGLRGIAPQRPFAAGVLVRPLLFFTRREILSYCEENGLEFVTDSSNADTAYTRNRLRADVVPILEALFDTPQKKATEAMCALGEDDAYLSALADELYEKAICDDGLRCEPLRDAPIPLFKRVLMRWVADHTGHSPERVHVEAISTLLFSDAAGTEVALTGDYVAVCERGLLRILTREREPLDMGELAFCEGESILFGNRVRLTVKKDGLNTNVHNLATQSCIILKMDSAIINNSLHWRTVRNGDRLLQGGMHKKLRKLYGEAGIPPHRRAQMPILCDGEGILWAPFIGVRDEIPTGKDAYMVRVELLSLETAFAESQRNGGVL